MARKAKPSNFKFFVKGYTISVNSLKIEQWGAVPEEVFIWGMSDCTDDLQIPY